MHPNIQQLAAYLDAALDGATQAATRAHILTCTTCAARLERLRADGQRIASLASSPAPDLRADLRLRLRRPGPASWLLRGATVAGALAALFLFAMLIGVSSGTVGRVPDRLLVIDQSAQQLIELDAANGQTLRSTTIGEQPNELRYHQRLDRVYVLLSDGVAAIDLRTLTVIGRWDADSSFGASAGMALDEARDRLYISWPSAGVISALDAATLTPLQLATDGRATISVGPAPGALLLAPDGQHLFTADSEDGQIWTIDVANDLAAASGRLLDPADVRMQRFLALSADGQTLYILRSGSTPSLQRVELRNWQASEPIPLGDGPLPWDLLLSDPSHLAIPRGDGRVGGVMIVATDNLSVTIHIDPDHDQHHLVAGPGGSFFGLNWLHGSVTRYDPARERAVVWLVTPLDRGRMWEGVYVGGGWRWPW
jgi:DNA-binding beta-propeller fold protein YncE